MPSTSAGISPSHRLHENRTDNAEQQALGSLLPKVADLLTASTSSTDTFQLMHDAQLQIQRQLSQQHHDCVG